MKLRVTASLVFVVYVFLAVYANAQALPPAKVIAIIDVVKISQRSKAAHSIQNEMKALRESYQKEISKQQETLREAEKELREKGKSLSKEDFTTKRKAFEKQAAHLQQSVLRHKRALDMAFSGAMKQLQAALVKQVGAYSKEKEIDIVLKRSQVYLAERALDITDEILKRVDKALPKIKVKKPKVQ